MDFIAFLKSDPIYMGFAIVGTLLLLFLIYVIWILK